MFTVCWHVFLGTIQMLFASKGSLKNALFPVCEREKEGGQYILCSILFRNFPIKYYRIFLIISYAFKCLYYVQFYYWNSDMEENLHFPWEKKLNTSNSLTQVLYFIKIGWSFTYSVGDGGEKSLNVNSSLKNRTDKRKKRKDCRIIRSRLTFLHFNSYDHHTFSVTVHSGWRKILLLWIHWSVISE